MAHVEAHEAGYFLPDGRPLLYDVSFRVGDGDRTVLLGANGAGKTTLLRMISGDLDPSEGTVVRSGAIGVLRQFIGSVRDGTAIRELLAGLAPAPIREGSARLARAEQAMLDHDDERSQLAYAQALSDWSDVGGWDAETLWETCCREALGLSFPRVADRRVATLSGGEQKRLALEALFRGPDELLLLDEPDNYLDVRGKRWLEGQLMGTGKTVLYISHDRELIAATARRVITVEARTTWTHGGGFASYHEARGRRIERLEELRRRWFEEEKRLKELVLTVRIQLRYSDALQGRYRALVTRLEKFQEIGPPPEPPKDQKIAIRLRGGRTGVRALECTSLALGGLTRPFDLEVFYGDRVAVLGANGSGKSHFLRLLDGEPVAHTGTFKLGARVVPGRFAQTHDTPELHRRTPYAAMRASRLDQGQAIGALIRYGLGPSRDQPFETLSGGQQARLQILLLETRGATMLVLDEPTDNLDLESAEALEDALESFDGTVLAVTHDRWFAKSFDRFIVFGESSAVYESTDPVWDEKRARR